MLSRDEYIQKSTKLLTSPGLIKIKCGKQAFEMMRKIVNKTTMAKTGPDATFFHYNGIHIMIHDQHFESDQMLTEEFNFLLSDDKFTTEDIRLVTFYNDDKVLVSDPYSGMEHAGMIFIDFSEENTVVDNCGRPQMGLVQYEPNPIHDSLAFKKGVEVPNKDIIFTDKATLQS